MSKESTPDLTKCYSNNILRNQDRSTLQDITKFETHLTANRKKFFKKLHDYIAQIQSRLVSLKTEVRGDFSMEIRDADYYRVNMFQLEGEITQLKQSITIELCNLMKEENEYCRDLQFMERRVEEWSKPATVKPPKTAPSAYRSSGNEDALSEFQKFLNSSGGHTGGWEEQDHLIFLRERRKYNGRSKFIQIVHSLLPDLSEDAINDHELWYQKYEQLRKDQKEEIRKWRATRQSSLEKRQDSSTDDRESSANPSRNYAAQRDITERIKEWKRQQLIKKAEEEERQKEEAQRQTEERVKKREIQKAKKSTINAYKAEKLSRQQAEIMSLQMKELQALEDRAKKNALLRVFREQDNQIIEKKKMQKFQSEWKEKRRMERLRNVKPSIELSVDRDPQRILQPTQTWHHHITQQDEITSSPTQFLTLQTIPHLAVPYWRKSIGYNQTL